MKRSDANMEICDFTAYILTPNNQYDLIINILN